MSRAWAAIAAFALAGAACLWFVLSERYSSGNVYSEYSSQRTDRLGTAALYEALVRAGVRASRNELPLDQSGVKDSTMLLVGFSPTLFTRQNIGEIEGAARNGNRVVIALDSAAYVFDYKKLNEPLWEKWRVRIVDSRKIEEPYAQRRREQVRFEMDAASGWHEGTRVFGRGSVTLIGGSWAFTNEALKQQRDLSVVEAAVGDARRVVFDETHLGTVQSGTVMGLVRQFRLQGVVAVALICALLFVWRSSSPFPPERAGAEDAEMRLAAASAGEGVLNLLTVHIPAERLVQTCVSEWKRDRGRLVSPDTVARIDALAGRKTDPVTQSREIRALLDRKAK